MARWSRFAPAADRRLVKALHDGDDDALVMLYDVYAERLYDYCTVLLGESKAAGDVVHDTLIDAARRAPRMRERDKLRAWLYASARRRSVLRRRPAVLSGEEGFSRLDAGQREVLFLALRHGVTGDELADVLGLPARRIQKSLDRATSRVPDAAKLLDAIEVPELPAALRHRFMHAGTDPELSGYRTEIAARGGALTADGMPRQPDARGSLARRWALAGSGSVATLAVAIVVLIFVSPSVPVPNLHWPGQRPDRPRSPVTEQHRTTPAPTGAPGGGPGARSPGRALPGGSTPSHKPKQPAPTGGPPSQGPGVLSVVPQSVHLRANAKIGEIRLAAHRGDVTWTASDTDPRIVLSNVSGGLPDGATTTVQVILQRQAVTLPGETTVTVTDGEGASTAVTVSWDLSLL